MGDLKNCNSSEPSGGSGGHGVGSQPQPHLILINPTDYAFNDRFYSEEAARDAARDLARANPGVCVSVAMIIATALVPLPNVEWSFGVGLATHLITSRGITRCGADYPNMRSTEIRANVTCRLCNEEAK